MKDNGFSQLEQLIRNKEGGLISYDQDRVPYILKTYYEGRECNLKDVRECQSAARTLGRLHNAMHLPELVQEYDVPCLLYTSSLENKPEEPVFVFFGNCDIYFLYLNYNIIQK